MRRILSVLIAMSFIFSSCNNDNKTEGEMMGENPFLGTYNTPFQTPTFKSIKPEHYMPAFLDGIEKHSKEIEKIVSNKEKANFENTIAALDYSGSQLQKVSSVFYNLTSAETNDELKKIASELSPIMSKHYDNISLNPDLFKRVEEVYLNKENLNLNPVQLRLLDKTYKSFVRNGANLEGESKDRMREINTKLSSLSLKFGENILAENNSFKMFIENKEDLKGLPQGVINSAAISAKSEGKEGQWLFTIHKPSLLPFLTYSENRDLREKLFKGYINKGDNNNEFDNKKILEEIANLRIEKANLLGYESWALYILDENMAKKPENVNRLLFELMDYALPVAKKELSDMQEIVNKEGGDFEIQAWDWWFYAEKVKKAKYNFDENQLMPYFELENVRDGAFEVAKRLFGIELKERNDIETYSDDVKVFEVFEADGTHIGIFYVDYYVRPGKRGGAWMNSYRKQMTSEKGEFVTPIITNVCNFSRPNEEGVVLLTVDQVQTLFHEFGHGLHGLLSNGVYPSLTGTSVARDFVELPSQIMENWSLDPEVLKLYAKHYKTGEVIPNELIEKLNNASKFNQGFTTVEYISAAILDMDWHSLKKVGDISANDFEAASMKNMNMLDEIVVRYRSPYFSHIFSGGYSSGYYAYVWAEILDADAFEAFKETSIFDKETATKFRKFVLEKGGSEEGMELYRQFRGKDASAEALMKRKGFK